nr:plasmid mobilization relaxosome protein MobC [Roseospira navarrensis]
MPLARYLREAAVKTQVVNRQDWRRLVFQVNRIGNNLNQVARWCNTYKDAAEAAGVVAALMQIDRGIRDLALPSRDASEGDAS